MIEAERRALAALNFSYTLANEDVWRKSDVNVPELNHAVVDSVFQDVDIIGSGGGSSPIGVVVQGRNGSGKTHMVGMLREHTQKQGGYFFLINLMNGKTFWESAALGVVDGLLRNNASWLTQVKAFLRRLTPTLGLSAETRNAIAGDIPLTPDHLDAFIIGLRTLDRALGQETQDTARALVLHNCDDFAAQDLAYAYFQSQDLGESPERTKWRLTAQPRTSQLIVRDLTKLFAITGPTVIAIDQVDGLFANAVNSMNASAMPMSPQDAELVGQIGDGLMALRDMCRRTLTVMMCVPASWALIKNATAGPIPDRFRETSRIDRIGDARIGRELVRRRFDQKFRELGFTPPYPTWPIQDAAFDDVVNFTPRQLLREVREHIAECLRSGVVTELERFVAAEKPRVPTSCGPSPSPTADALIADPAQLDAWDDRFTALRDEAEISAALDPTTEDTVMPALLAAGLSAWVEERGGAGTAYKVDPPPGMRPALHARLRLVLDEEKDQEVHWAFRAISSNSAIAALSRIRAASTDSGLDRDVATRHLTLLRNLPWSAGPKTTATIAAFRDAGGVHTRVSDEDLRTFTALRQMLDEHDESLGAWLIARQPASQTTLFQTMLPPSADDAGPPTTSPQPTPAGPTTHIPEQREPEPPLTTEVAPLEVDGRPDAPDAPTVPLGTGMVDGRAFGVDLEALRKHTALFAGSGSGKTVLIRRLVEECALQGVSAIVLDPNNDLSRLGDAPPETPDGWGEGDDAKSREYRETVDVVVWTPRITSGRPLSFQPLPNFAAVRNDPDEFQAAIDIAASMLAPRARVDGKTAKARLGQAVLRDALDYYAEKGGTGGRLGDFIDLLRDLPEDVSALNKGQRLAAELAEILTAEMVNDPLFGGEGVPVDPNTLLTPAPGKRARVSVISFIGLNSDEQKQGFVNQLQMALFSWIKRNPAGDRPLGGLFVMDEAQTLAPSTGNTSCTKSTLALVSQARKYGLGLVFATQAPKGLHNHIPGNCATQFFGLLNSPTQIAAAKEMAQAKGGSVPEIGLLRAGQFYAATEGSSFVKIQAPMCLTHHPRAPLTPEEVIARSHTDIG